MSNNIIVTISARDNASRVIDGLGNSIAGASFKAQLLSQALFLGVGAGLTALGDKIKQASGLQLDAINAASTYTALTGKGVKESERVIAELDARLSRVAASLPGTTQDYKDLALAIQDNLIPAFVGANGVLNENAFLDGITEITRGMGFLGAASQIAAKDVSKITAKFLGGSSIAELKELLFAEANPAFLALVERKLEASGKKLEDLTVKERTAILRAVQAQLVTDDTIKAASGSVSGITESFLDKLFNPTQGIFGLLRDLDSNIDGSQSVLTALNEALEALLGDGGLLAKIGTILNLVGIKDTSFLKLLKSGIESLTNWINNFSSALDVLLVDPFGTNLGELFNIEGLGKGLAEIVNNGVEYLSNLDWEAIFEAIGYIAAKIVNELSSFIVNLDYGQIIGLLFKVANSFFIGLGRFLTTINWGQLGDAVAYLLIGGLVGLGASLIAPLITGVELLGIAIAAAIVSVGTVIYAEWNNIVSGIVDYFTGLYESALKLIEDTWKQLIANPIGLVRGLFTKLVTGVKGAFDEMTSSVFEFFTNITNSFKELPKKLVTGVGSLVNKGSLQGGIYAGSSNPIGIGGNLITRVFSWLSGRKDNFASGLNYLPLLAAAEKEMKEAPSGASIVVANSSEAILNKSQQNNLLNTIAANKQRIVVPSQGGLSIGNINIYTQATDAAGIAKEVMKQIARAYEDYTVNNLAVATV